jgi:hypothetical protein
MAREIVNKITVSEPITLADLRWLVDQCVDMEPTSRVEVTAHKQYDQRDWDAATITVHGKPSSGRQVGNGTVVDRS